MGRGDFDAERRGDVLIVGGCTACRPRGASARDGAVFVKNVPLAVPGRGMIAVACGNIRGAIT